MESSTNVYASEPAFPVLATQLLRRRPAANKADNASGHDRGNLPLRRQFTMGVGLRDDNTRLVRTGTITGFSYVKELNQSQGTYTYTMTGHERGRERMGELTRKIISSFLLADRNHTDTGKGGMVVYIIRPPLGGGDSLLTPEALLSSILAVAGERDREEDGILTRDQAVGLLDHVHLLPVPDVTAVAQAVGQISDEILPYDGDRLDESSRPPEQQGKQQQVLLILEGLDILTENLIRSSNSLRGCAVIVPILRTLTYLTRSYADRLAVLVVNGVGLLSVDSSSSLSYSTAAPGSASFTSSSSSSLQRDTRSADAGSAGGASLLQSVFGGLVVRQPLLSRTLDYGVDVHLLVSIRGDGHDASSKATAAVEVVKDRVGGFLGEWCFV